MKAVVLHAYGDASQLRYEDVEVPECGADEVLVKVHATSINPIDFKLRSGAAKARMPLEFPAILGRDLAGEIVKVGRDVKNFSDGQRVMGLTNHTYAEFAAVKADVLAIIPQALNFEQAAALPLVTTTGAQLMEHAVQIQPGQTVLVTGALGGVGRTAVHVAKQHGARVFVGVRSSEKVKASELGADQVVAIDSAEEIGRLKDLDAIADTVGGEIIQKLLPALRKGGVLGSVLGAPEGAEKFDIRVEAFMAQPDAARLQQLADDVARRELSIPIAKTMNLKDIQEAHRLAEKGGLAGKIIILP